MEHKRISLFAGHYGSGKTNIAVNYAMHLKSAGHSVTVADLDIVNPYFRTKDSEDLLKMNGISLICSPFANSNLDVPAMPKETQALINDRSEYAVIDVGGDDRGALALGRYTSQIKDEDNYEMLFVANKARPLTRTAKEAFEVMKEIEAASRLPFTAIINNTNIGKDTEADDVLASLAFADELSAISGLPVKFTSVNEKLLPALAGKIKDLFPLRLQELYYQIKTED